MTNEFLRDLDQWDEESQGILLSLAEKDQLISVEEIEKGILGKGASLFEKIILNDDDSNRMISPFYEKFDIVDSPNSGKNIMLDTKVSEFNFTGKDENNQSTFAYRTIVHELPGSEVYKQYKIEKAGFDAHFLKLYYEKLNTERIFNFTGRFCLLNIGKTYYNNIISNFPNKGIVSYYGENKHSVYVNSIQSEVSYTKKVIDSVYANNQLSEKEILKALKLALWQYSPTGSIVNAIGNINDGLADAVSLLASGVGKLKIAENGYLPSESNYQPFLLKQANSSPTISSMEIGISILEQVIRKGINSIEDYLDNINDAIPIGFRNAIREVTLFTNQLNEMIQSVMPILEDFGAEYFKLINAFVCGIINGLISLIEFIFQIISFGIGLDTSIKSYDDYAERQSYLEVMEEALDVLLKSVPELLNGLINLIKTVNQEDTENLLQLIKRLLGNVTRYELAYYGGAIVFEIITGVILAFLTGGTGNVAKAVGTSQKLIESLKIIGREFISSVTFGVSDLLAIFRNLIQSFIRACKNGFKGFLEWVRSLLKQDGRHLDDVLEDIEQKPIGGKGAIGKGIVIGKYSKRPFNPESAGGPILNLKWNRAKITREGIEIVKKHLSRFDSVTANKKMIERLEQIDRREIEITDWDRRFYTHELREYERYQNIGIKDGVNVEEVYNDAHTATLEDFRLSEFDKNGVDNIYHPSIPEIDFHF